MKTGVYYKIVFNIGLVWETVRYTKKQKRQMWRQISKQCKGYSKRFGEEVRIISVIKHIDID